MRKRRPTPDGFRSADGRTWAGRIPSVDPGDFGYSIEKATVTIDSWLIHSPDVSEEASHFFMLAVALLELPGLPAPERHSPEMEFEVGVFSLDPEQTPDWLTPAQFTSEARSILTPANYQVQVGKPATAWAMRWACADVAQRMTIGGLLPVPRGHDAKSRASDRKVWVTAFVDALTGFLSDG